MVRQITRSPDGKVITIKDDFCWMCGKVFNNANFSDKRTYHHSLPQQYKSIKNVKLSICRKCHYDIHTMDTLFQKRFEMIRGVFMLYDSDIKKILEKRKRKKDESNEFNKSD